MEMAGIEQKLIIRMLEMSIMRLTTEILNMIARKEITIMAPLKSSKDRESESADLLSTYIFAYFRLL